MSSVWLRGGEDKNQKVTVKSKQKTACQWNTLLQKNLGTISRYASYYKPSQQEDTSLGNISGLRTNNCISKKLREQAQVRSE